MLDSSRRQLLLRMLGEFTVIVVGTGLAGSGAAAALGELGVNVETEIDQVLYEPMASSLSHDVSEFSDIVRDGLDLVPDEAIALFNEKESFSGA